jgi:hypothetical protein
VLLGAALHRCSPSLLLLLWLVQLLTSTVVRCVCPAAAVASSAAARRTCPHLCNLSLVQDHASNQLHIKGTQPQHSL